MKIVKNQEYTGSDSRKSLYDVYYISDGKPKPVVLFCHGFKGFKDFACFPLVYKYLAEKNYAVVAFNFSHNGGTTEIAENFPDLEAFSQNTYSKELYDVSVMLSLIQSETFLAKNDIDSTNIHILGHSRGGGIAIVSAYQHESIRSVATIGSISTFNRFPTDERLDFWRKENVVYIENKRTQQQLPLQFSLYEDFVENQRVLDLESTCKSLRKPFLILHGTADETVLDSEAKQLHHWNESSQLFLIQNANHTLGSSHPWKEEQLPKDFEITLEQFHQFIENQHSK